MRVLTGKELVVATHNGGKLAEMHDLLAPFGIKIYSAKDLSLPEPAETGVTFEENAYIKAFSAAQRTGLPALADDSGLVVDALGGAPGVYSADWSFTPDGGRDFDYAMQKVIASLENHPTKDGAPWTASFVSVLCLAWPDGHAEYFRGQIFGTICWPPRGDMGFGYDPMFKPDGYDKTFGEMTRDEKHGWQWGDTHALSHRAKAFKLFAETMFKKSAI